MRVGGEVTLEATHDALLLRTLAPSHAAYALVRLNQHMFERGSFASRDLQGEPLPASQDSAALGSQGAAAAAAAGAHYIKCKLHLKQILLAFRHSHHVERMQWELSSAQNALLIEASVGGVTSKYSIPFESQLNILQADFPRSAASSVLQLKPSLLLKALDLFPPKLSEVTLLLECQAAADGSAPPLEDATIRLKSFDQQLPAPHTLHGGQQIIEQSINTDTSIPCAQLERFDFAHSGTFELTFNVKEVRAFLSYCDGLGDFDCRLSFAGMGQPMLCETVPRHAHAAGLGAAAGGMQGRMDDEAADLAAPLKMDLVVATLADSQSQSQAQTPSQQPQATPRNQRQAAPVSSSQGAADQSQAFLQKQSAAMYRNSQDGRSQDGRDEYVPPTPQ